MGNNLLQLPPKNVFFSVMIANMDEQTSRESTCDELGKIKLNDASAITYDLDTRPPRKRQATPHTVSDTSTHIPNHCP